MKIAVIGAGISGLMCAYKLADKFDVTIFEKEDYAGGLCSRGCLGDFKIEKYNHFFSKKDAEIIKVINDLGLGSRLKWKKAGQASIIGDEFIDMSRPLSMFSLPKVNSIEKIKLAYFLLKSSVGKQGIKFNKYTACSWVLAECTANIFESYFKPMLKFKFQNYDDVSAAYLWARINEGKQNEIGFLKGGMRALINSLIEKIRGKGAKLILDLNIRRIEKTSENRWLLHDHNSSRQFDCVICCISLKEIEQLCDVELRASLEIPRTDHLNVGSYILKLKRPLKDGYWLFISQLESGLRTVLIDTSPITGDNIVYSPVYRRDNIITDEDKKNIFTDCVSALKNINRDFDLTWIKEKEFYQDNFVEPVLTNSFIDQITQAVENKDGFYMPDAMYERHLLKTVNTQAIRADMVFKKITERIGQ